MTYIPQNTENLQVASVKLFMESFGYSYYPIDKVFVSDYRTNKARVIISMRTAIALHNGAYTDWHGRIFREPFQDIPEMLIDIAKSSKLVAVAKLQVTKNKRIIVQDHRVAFLNEDNIKLFIKEE